MTTIDNVTTLKAPPLRVWTVLTDFAGHPRWKPFIQLSGAAAVGGDATYTFRIGGLDKSITAEADIIRVDKPLAFAWTAGVAKFLLFEEAYALESDPTGTRLRHSLRFSGLFASPLAALMRRKLQASLVRSDECLERHLRHLSPSQRPKDPAPPSRAGVNRQRRRR
jgi:uncharacterized protein YndB with AHSA1/START domain